jgi:hypothetical protein
MASDDVPQDFDKTGYDQLGAHMGKHPNKVGRDGWANAHNGVQYRFRGAALADERFASTFSVTGDRYVQEEALFGFFFNAVSCVECFLFGLYHIGAVVSPGAFPIATNQDLSRIRRDKVKDGFRRSFPGVGLTKLIALVVDDPNFLNILQYRDVLTHRGTIPRRHRVVPREPGHVRIPDDVDAVFMTAAPKAAGEKDSVVPLDATTTSLPRVWLARRVRELLGETLRFCQVRLP